MGPTARAARSCSVVLLGSSCLGGTPFGSSGLLEGILESQTSPSRTGACCGNSELVVGVVRLRNVSPRGFQGAHTPSSWPSTLNSNFFLSRHDTLLRDASAMHDTAVHELLFASHACKSRAHRETFSIQTSSTGLDLYTVHLSTSRFMHISRFLQIPTMLNERNTANI